MQLSKAGSAVGQMTGYGLDGPGIEFWWGRDFLHLSRLALGPTQPLYNGYRLFPGDKQRLGHDADPSPSSSAVVKKEYSYTSTPPMGHTACREPQCLYKGALCVTFFYAVKWTMRNNLLNFGQVRMNYIKKYTTNISY